MRDRTDGYTEFASVIAPRLFRSALLLCGDWQLAEDLVQTTLAKLFVAWKKASRADNPEAYARGVLTKTFLSHQRVRRNSELPTDQVAERLAEGPDSALRLDLLAALRDLDKVDRAVVVLRYWEDRTVSETAHHLSMSEAAVKTRASRAMGKLRVALTASKEASA